MYKTMPKGTGEAETAGERIAQARRELAAKRREDISQTGLAALVGVEPPTVSRWEAGLKTPSGPNLLKLARVLEKSPEWLIYGSGKATDPTRVREIAKAAKAVEDVVLGQSTAAKPKKRASGK